jgi:anti-anti-sigma factor
MSMNRHIEVEREADVFRVRLKRRQMDELDVHEMADELHTLINAEGCRKLLLSLGPGTPQFLYSLFLAKLVGIRRRLLELQGQLMLTDITPEVMSVFDKCQLDKYFDFAQDRDAAMSALRTPS